MTLQLFKLTGGAVSWTHPGSFTNHDGDFCSGSSQGSYSLQSSVNDGYRWIGVCREARLASRCLSQSTTCVVFSPEATPPDNYECTDPQGNPYSNTPIYGSYNLWVDTDGGIFPTVSSLGLYDYDPTGNTLAGSSILRDRCSWYFGGTMTRTFTWLFNKNGTFNGEPEL